jgi:WD40 repeat protein
VNRLASRGVAGSIAAALTGKPLHTIVLKGRSNLGRFAISPDGKHIVAGSDDYTVKVWDAQSGEDLLTFKGPRRGSTLATSGRCGTMALVSRQSVHRMLNVLQERFADLDPDHTADEQG